MTITGNTGQTRPEIPRDKINVQGQECPVHKTFLQNQVFENFRKIFSETAAIILLLKYLISDS